MPHSSHSLRPLPKQHVHQRRQSPLPATKASTAEKIGTFEGGSLVALGAMVGAGIRAAIGLLPLPDNPLPVTTLLVNLGGAFLLGLLYSILDGLELAAARRHNGSGSRTRMILRLLLGTGVMGGLTTYSTFILEVDSRFAQGQPWIALAYGVGSLLFGWCAVFLGDLLGRGILSLRSHHPEPDVENGTTITEADAENNAEAEVEDHAEIESDADADAKIHTNIDGEADVQSDREGRKAQ